MKEGKTRRTPEEGMVPCGVPEGQMQKENIIFLPWNKRNQRGILRSLITAEN
jgi:hypothetical protein